MKMTKESEREYMELLRQHPKAYLVLMLLIRNMSDDNAILISKKTITELVNIGTTTADTAINILEEFKFIKKSKIGSTNIYHINSAVVTVKNGYEGCQFNATVLMGKYETNLNKGNYDIRQKVMK